MIDQIQEFLTGRRHQPEIERVLKTVLFTDIVASTEQASQLGDRRWRELLDKHDRAIRLDLERYRGEEVNTTGDGFLACFDGPARAIRCAQAMIGAARALGIEIRGGSAHRRVRIAGLRPGRHRSARRRKGCGARRCR